MSTLFADETTFMEITVEEGSHLHLEQQQTLQAPTISPQAGWNARNGAEQGTAFGQRGASCFGESEQEKTYGE